MYLNKILIIRFRRVGDAVVSSVLCSSLKRSFPDAEIHYVLNENIAPLFEHHPDIDRIIRFSPRELDHFPSYVKKIRSIMQSGRYDLIVDTRATLRTLLFSLFSLHTPYRIGEKKAYNFGLLNRRVEICPQDVVQELLSLLKPLEKEYAIEYQKDFRLYVTPEEKEAYSVYMRSKGIDFSRPVIVCAVTARLAHKVWDKDRMKEILCRIIEKRPDAQLVFNYGGAEELAFAKQLHEDMAYDPQVFLSVEAKGIRELAALLSLSNFFFGNEGGPRHISQAFQVPSFAIFPPRTSMEKWLPNASGRYQGIAPSALPEEEAKRLTFKQQFDRITTEEVWSRLEGMLERYL